MQLLLWTSSLLLFLVNSVTGLRCYACVPSREIAGVKLPAVLTDRLSKSPRCADMKVKDPSLHYELPCPPGLDTTCVKIRDEHGNEMRSCFGAKVAKCAPQKKEGQVLCTCKGDFCNAATSSAPGLLGLITAAVAVFVRLH